MSGQATQARTRMSWLHGMASHGYHRTGTGQFRFPQSRFRVPACGLRGMEIALDCTRVIRPLESESSRQATQAVAGVVVFNLQTVTCHVCGAGKYFLRLRGRPRQGRSFRLLRKGDHGVPRPASPTTLKSFRGQLIPSQPAFSPSRRNTKRNLGLIPCEDSSANRRWLSRDIDNVPMRRH